MLRVEKYGRRTFAVYEADALLAVVCYRKGAEAIRRRIEELRQRVADLEARRTPAAAARPVPPQSYGVAADAPEGPPLSFECDCLIWDEHINCVTTGKPFRVARALQSDGRDPVPSGQARQSASGSVRRRRAREGGDAERS